MSFFNYTIKDERYGGALPNTPKIIFHAILGIILLIILSSFWPLVSVGAGERGIVLNWGAVAGKVQQPGLNFRMPIMQDVVKMNVQIQKEQVKAEAASHDLQTVSADVALNYHLDANKIADIYRNVGEDYKTKLIDPALQEAVKSVTANYTAEELITKREQVRSDIKDALSTKLSPSGLNVDEFNVINFDFSAQFNQAIESKVTAEQNALAAKNKLDQVKYEAQQRIEQANGEAQAIKIQASAIQSQGGADYVKLQAIAKWDGKLPQYQLSGATPFIDVSK
jgi:regulator of protease activity HflC (stomatin/prohibitin superfamily)